MERYRGTERPEQDIGEFLDDVFGVNVRDLTGELDEAPQPIRAAVQEQWLAIHEERRGDQRDIDDHAMMRLANHDVEMYLGTVERRKRESRSFALSYSTWWLTLDRAAFHITNKINEVIEEEILSPVMSVDFLLNYLAFAPVRSRIPKNTEAALPVTVESRMMDIYIQQSWWI